MTLTIELTPEQEARLAAAASQRGLAPGELAQELLVEHLPQNHGTGTRGASGRDPELVRRVREIRGKYARLGIGTEDLHADRYADKERDSGTGA